VPTRKPVVFAACAGVQVPTRKPVVFVACAGVQVLTHQSAPMIP
jgi:hypothetical protein